MRAPLIHVASQVFDTPLMILRPKLEAILSAVGHRLVFDQAALQELLDSQALLTHPERRPDLLKYSAAWDDDEDDFDNGGGSSQSRKPYQVTQAGVAVIPVCGALMKKGNWMSALSGFSSYDGITKAVKGAMADSSVRALLFNVDSPGGTTHGCFELSDLIHSYRGRKPMFAAANDLAASAAYAIASSADRIFVTRTGAVGSIGVFCLHADVAGLDDKLGVKYTYIHFGAKKVDGNEHSSLSASARSDMQAEVDREGEMFVATVARNRGVSRESILATEAGCFFADAALPLLADSVGAYDDALAALTNKIGGGSVMIQGSSELQPKLSAQAGTQQAPVQGADKMADLIELKKQADDANAAFLAAQKEEEDSLAARGYIPKNRRAAAASAASDPKEPDKDDAPPEPKKKKADMPPDDTTCDDDAKKAIAAAVASGQTASANAASEIADLCMLAGYDGNTPGKPNMLGTFLSEKKTVAEARKALQELRAAESSKNPTDPSFGASVSSDSIDSITKQAGALSANSGGSLSPSRAMEKVLKSNPKLYVSYCQERAVAASTPHGTESYIAKVRPQMEALNLSSEISGL